MTDTLADGERGKPEGLTLRQQAFVDAMLHSQRTFTRPQRVTPVHNRTFRLFGWTFSFVWWRPLPPTPSQPISLAELYAITDPA